jgi:glycosyltransferase involved in cell wall biosynthesis
MFDEEANVGTLLEHALALAPRLADEFEVIVVDDGSRDGSAAVVRAIARRDARVRLLQHPRNRGYGAALRSGLRAARGEWIFFSDADLQFDLGEIEQLLAHTDEFDIVAGHRAPRRDPAGRRVLAWGWGLLVRGLFDLRVRDIDCAFKLFRRSVIDALEMASIGAFVNTEILVRARSAGFRIREVPVSHRPRPAGRAKGASPRVVWRAMVELSTLYRDLTRGHARRGVARSRSVEAARRLD